MKDTPPYSTLFYGILWRLLEKFLRKIIKLTILSAENNGHMDNFYIRDGFPTFDDLPWDYPLPSWKDRCNRLEEVQRGLSRHPVVFVNYGGVLYAIKELPALVGQQEFNILSKMEMERLPSVIPAGYAHLNSNGNEHSVLITRYLDRSLPYRSLFIHSSLGRYRDHILGAMAGLLVQLHLNGVFWGDCSLSNTLFRRDAGALKAYLVDAETAEIHPPRLSPMLRHHDLQIMEENVNRDLNELETSEVYTPTQLDYETVQDIRLVYRALWEEVTRDEIILSNERYRIQERIRALNMLGFSVRDVEIIDTDKGDQLRLRYLVTDRNFHRDQLLDLIGLEAEEMQAHKIMNEIYEVRAYLAQENNRPIPLSVASYHWLQFYYLATVEQLKPLIESKNQGHGNNDLVELYCQVLEHKWYLSESAQHDVGHQAAAQDFVKRFGPSGNQ